MRPSIAQIGIGDDRHQRSTSTYPCPVPDLGLTRGDSDDRIHLTVDELLPTLRVVGSLFGTCLELEELMLTSRISLQVDL